MFCAERQEVFFSLFFSTVYWMQKQMTIQSSLIELINHECIINGNKSHPSLCLCKWALSPPSLVLCIKGMPLKYRPVWVNTTMSCLSFFFYHGALRGRKFESRRWVVVVVVVVVVIVQGLHWWWDTQSTRRLFGRLEVVTQSGKESETLTWSLTKFKLLVVTDR